MTYADLRDKVALITGGANGIGKATAAAFLAEGARVAIVDISADALAKAAVELESGSDRLITVPADISNEEDVKDYVRATVDAFGTIDVLFNNAGIEGARAPIIEQDVESFDRVLAINVRGTFLGLKHVLPIMYAKQAGSIINTSSIGGLTAGPGEGVTPYVSSKFAITGLTRLTAKEAARHQVRVNSVHPGMIDTDMLDRLGEPGASGAGAATKQFSTSGIPLGRLGEPANVAAMVLFLASEASTYISGSQFRVDGGVLA